MTEWFEGRGVDDIPKAGTIVPKPVWAMVVGLAVAGVFYAGRVSAEPVFKATSGKGVVITLYDDPCELKDQVTNLPFKATWTEGDKTFQGCWAPVTQMGVAQMWFTDKTAFLVPFQAFTKITSA